MLETEKKADIDIRLMLVDRRFFFIELQRLAFNPPASQYLTILTLSGTVRTKTG